MPQGLPPSPGGWPEPVNNSNLMGFHVHKFRKFIVNFVAYADFLSIVPPELPPPFLSGFWQKVQFMVGALDGVNTPPNGNV